MTQAPHREVSPPLELEDGEARPPADGASAPPAAPNRRRRLGAVAAVALAAGLLFGTSATLLRQGEERQPENLADLVAVERERLEGVSGEVEALRVEVEALVAEGSGTPASPPTQTWAEPMEAGRVAVVGPGVAVRMWDAPTANAPAGTRPDDLLVHQQDIEAVVNAMWAGGAEAMTIQGQRVTSDTAVRCVGNVLLLRGRTYSPPYEIAAIGDPEDLMASLDDSPGVAIYLQYVAAVGLGWSAGERAVIEMPAAEGPSAFTHATVVEAVPPEQTREDARATSPAEETP